MKKIILFIVMLLGFGLVTNAQTASTIEFNSAGGNMPAVNDNFDVPISVSGLDATSMPAGITAIIIDFTYDNTVLTHTGLTNTVAGLTYDFHEETLGTIHIEIYDWINLWYNVDGNIFDFQFDYDVAAGFSSFVFESTTRYGDDGFIEIPFPSMSMSLVILCSFIPSAKDFIVSVIEFRLSSISISFICFHLFVFVLSRVKIIF